MQGPLIAASVRPGPRLGGLLALYCAGTLPQYCYYACHLQVLRSLCAKEQQCLPTGWLVGWPSDKQSREVAAVHGRETPI